MLNFKDIFVKEVPEKQILKLPFDVDSSPIVWKVYENVYNLKNKRAYLKLNGSRLCLMLNKVDPNELEKVFGIKNKFSLGKKFKIAGDCDFNFNKDKLSKLKKIIKNDGSEMELENTLDHCNKFHPDLFTKICKIPIKHMLHAFDGYFVFSPFKYTKRASALV